MRENQSGFPTRCDTNRPVQSLRRLEAWRRNCIIGVAKTKVPISCAVKSSFLMSRLILYLGPCQIHRAGFLGSISQHMRAPLAPQLNEQISGSHNAPTPSDSLRYNLLKSAIGNRTYCPLRSNLVMGER